jgi:mRNA-degrading endonuclease RelE of RelBE toxin-antitoxin system
MVVARVELTRRATRDFRGLSPPDHRRAAQALAATLASEPLPANADDRSLTGRAPWRRLRVGELRVIYRAFEPDEIAGVEGGRLVARVVHRGELERAVATLR